MNKLIEKIEKRISEISELIRPVGWSKKIEVAEAKAVLDIIREEAKAYKGEWKFDISGVGHYNCSVCGGRGDFYGKYNYCPHCGSQMKEDVEAKAYNESVKGDLISRSALLDWINEQRKDVTKKQVAGSDGIFTRAVLVTMQRCIGTFETAINNQPTACNDGWIPINPDDESTFPPNDEYILLSLSNFSIPIVGRYEIDENGGAFYCGDEEETLVSQDMFVNAWRSLPQPYKENENE